MEQIKALFTNYLLMSAVASWLLAQIMKVFTGMYKNRKFTVTEFLFSNGGMPSSHTAAVCALATASIIKFGVSSFECAISCVFAIVVMMDASGVRYETGEQSKILNKITKELFSGRPEEMNTALKEIVGHTPFQVLMGAILGIVMGILFSLFML
ncbi:MAG: divergent PAP2 family protein [Ruminococcaceae bacterium]|nr:divergent PAP2 family protein [Oscillospiraceae bacterium]